MKLSESEFCDKHDMTDCCFGDLYTNDTAAWGSLILTDPDRL